MTRAEKLAKLAELRREVEALEKEVSVQVGDRVVIRGVVEEVCTDPTDMIPIKVRLADDDYEYFALQNVEPAP